MMTVIKAKRIISRHRKRRNMYVSMPFLWSCKASRVIESMKHRRVLTHHVRRRHRYNRQQPLPWPTQQVGGPFPAQTASVQRTQAGETTNSGGGR